MDATIEAAARFKYRAFISYSHRDRRWAEWLHRAIEGYRVPRSLVGRSGRDGPIPRQLFPVFRDREELASSPDLNEALRAAIDGSAALVVICSPAAARSLWVNQEVMLFKQLGREDRIFAAIVDGEPECEDDGRCFPAALRFRLRPDGSPGEVRAEPVAADLRPGGDGREAGKLKLIAGLLGVPLNDLKHRELLAARRRARLYQGIAAAMLVLALVAVAGGVLSWRYARHAEGLLAQGIRISAGQVAAAVRLADQSGISRKLIDALLGETDRAFEGLQLAAGEAPRLPWRDARVPAALRAEHGVLLLVLADHYGIIGESARQAETAARARHILEEVVAEEPLRSDWRRELARSFDVTGDALGKQWQVEQALEAFRAALAVRERLRKTLPEDPSVLRDVALSKTLVGDMLRRQGDWAQALAAYREADTIGARLLDGDPDNQSLQRDLMMGQQRQGDMLVKQGALAGAEATFRSSLRHAERLAAKAPEDVQAQRDLSVGYDKLGQILRKRGDQTGSEESLRSALATIRPLAEADRGNVGLQRDLAKSLDALGVLLLDRGDRGAGRTLLQQAMATSEAVVRADPGNALFRRELTVAWNRLADVHAAEGEDAAALALYRKSQVVREELAAADPSNAQAARDLALVHERIGQQLSREGKFDDAVDAFRHTAEIQQRLAQDQQDNPQWRRELAAALRNLGRALGLQGDPVSAAEVFRRALAVSEPLGRAPAAGVADQQALLNAYMDLADTEAALHRTAQATAAYCSARSLAALVLARDPANADWQRYRSKIENALYDMQPEMPAC